MPAGNNAIPIIWKFISYSSPLVLIIGIVSGFILYKGLQQKNKIIVWFFLGSLSCDIFHRLVVYLHITKYNLFSIPLLGIIELLFFTWIYERVLLKKRTRLSKYIKIGILLVLLAEFTYTILAKNPASFFSYGKVASNLYIIVFCLMYIHYIFSSSDLLKMNDSILFNSGVLTYFTFNLLISLSVNFLINEELHIVLYFWMANAIITIIFYLFNIYLLWKNGKNRNPLRFG